MPTIELNSNTEMILARVLFSHYPPGTWTGDSWGTMLSRNNELDQEIVSIYLEEAQVILGEILSSIQGA